MESIEKRYKKWLRNTDFKELIGDGVIICDVCNNPISKVIPMVHVRLMQGADKVYNHGYHKLSYGHPKEISDCLGIRNGGIS